MNQMDRVGGLHATVVEGRHSIKESSQIRGF